LSAKIEAERITAGIIGCVGRRAADAGSEGDDVDEIACTDIVDEILVEHSDADREVDQLGAGAGGTDGFRRVVACLGGIADDERRKHDRLILLIVLPGGRSRARSLSKRRPCREWQKRSKAHASDRAW
jgi:hypothetical protein